MHACMHAVDQSSGIMECSTAILILLVLLMLQLSGGETTSCPNISATADTKPLYLLTSFTHGLRVLSGARIYLKMRSTTALTFSLATTMN